ncbi:putative GntR-family transcriptional regulator [Streptomyces sp. Tu6071]|nr:putative GntR-family transcriptional regulator [Streptomyces sp. Tu6071]
MSRSGALIVFHRPSNHAADWLTKAASRGPASWSKAKSTASVPSASKVSTCAGP